MGQWFTRVDRGTRADRRDASGSLKTCPRKLGGAISFRHRISTHDHLRKQSSKAIRLEIHRGGMLKVAASRGGFVRAVCVLCVALVCVMGTVQATHSHTENSTTARHTCTICATAHAGLSTQTGASAPVLATAVLAVLVADVAPIFRPLTTQFIRPPPAF